MSSVPSELGLDADSLEWQDIALCRASEMPTSLFYEDYENSATVAKNVDDACLSCPVLAQCAQAGVENNEWGCWGGIYLTSGKPDVNKNSHKTPEVWREIQERISGSGILG